MVDPIVYLDGTWVKQSQAKISITDAGFLYGDGLFETIRFQNQKLFRPDKHLKRLQDGLNTLQLHMDVIEKQSMDLLNGSITRNNLQNGLLRLIITRGKIDSIPWTHSGPPSMYILPRSLSPVPESPVKIVWFQESSYPLIRFKPAIKSVNYLGNMLAKKDAQALGAFEPIFVNPDGFITEGAIRNICFIRDNTVITPGVNLGVLPGVMRDTVIEVVQAMNVEFREENIPLSKVNLMDEAFISSTGVGVVPCYWDGWQSDYKITGTIKKEIENILRNCSSFNNQ